MVQNLSALKSEIKLQNPTHITGALVFEYFDAAHSGTYGQGGYLAELCIQQLDGTALYFISDLDSPSLSRVVFSSTGAEILAAANAADRGLTLTAIAATLQQRQNMSCLSSLSTLVVFLTQWNFS
jgi:hypothetical protein